MPFKSKAQMRWMFATHPGMAKEWASKTPDMKGMPEHVRGKGDTSRMAQSAFDRLAGKLANRKGVSNPRALAAYIGRQKYGASGMAAKSAAGRRKKRRRRRRHH